MSVKPGLCPLNLVYVIDKPGLRTYPRFLELVCIWLAIRYRTDVRKQNTISDKEHAELQSLENNLLDCYRRYTDVLQIVECGVSKCLESVYMEKLCQ